MKMISCFPKPSFPLSRFKSTCGLLLLLAALPGAAQATTVVLNPSSSGGGNYSSTVIPGIWINHQVGWSSAISTSSGGPYEWSFTTLQFDLTGINSEVESAIFTTQLAQNATKSAVVATVGVYALNTPYADTDGTDDGDFEDYIETGAGGQYYYTSHPDGTIEEFNGNPDAATAWYESNFGSETIPVASVGSMGFDGVTAGSGATLDITDLVNAWVRGEVENLGIGMILTGSEANRISLGNSTLRINQVPEPSSIMLMAAGAFVAIGIRRRQA